MSFVPCEEVVAVTAFWEVFPQPTSNKLADMTKPQDFRDLFIIFGNLESFLTTSYNNAYMKVVYSGCFVAFGAL